MAEIDREAWLHALHVEEPSAHADALTCGELAVLIGAGKTTTKERLQKAIQEGRVNRVMKRVRRVDGKTIPVPAYRLKPGETL